MTDLPDDTPDCRPLDRVTDDIGGKIDRQTYTLEQLAKWKAEADKWRQRCEQIAGRELMRQGRREQLYTNFELAQAVAASIDEDGKGNLMATLKR